ncbi:MAG TPA: beta-ketoacyl synthase chain length factor [Ramlibacter sp.]|nr:beta-ketoacyl synthase chain length factor [Ramlibacter sp.]
MKPLSFQLHAAGVLAPGLGSLAQLRSVARGDEALAPEPLALPAPGQLPANERRRASQVVRLTLACIAQALEASPVDGSSLRSVFAADEGTGEVCQQMLEALATTGQVSPLLFTNSVHNAPSGYFSIAWRNEQPATVVSLGTESFASGLLCAATDAAATGQPVLLVACDPVMTAPLDELLPIVHGTCAAWVLSAAEDHAPDAGLGRFRMQLQPAAGAAPSALPEWMPGAWHGNSSARALAALELLDAPAGTVLRLSLGGQSLALWREGAAA